MTTELERRAAGLFTVGFRGKSLDADLRALLARGIGGVIAFTRNVGTPSEVLELNTELKRAAARPLLLSVDQEGGQVARLRRGFTEIPSMRTLGATRNTALAHDLGRMIGREVRAVGFDMSYAPVLDVDTNPANPVIGARAFGRAPELVAELGVALASGLEQAGVAACGKHFPGHGDTSQDSHLELPRLPHSLERLQRIELPPFRAAAQARIACFMTAHVIFEAVDARHPATMSRAVVNGILRGQLGFEGLVITDDLEMKAIANHFDIEEVVQLGLNAGVDHFLCCHTAELAHRAIDAVVKAVERGDVHRETLDAATLRFERVKARFEKPVGDVRALEVLRSPEHLALVSRVVRDSDRALAEAASDPTETRDRSIPEPSQSGASLPERQA